jgi:hypothetical protein
MLEQFTCTTPAPRGRHGRRLPHPRPWELEVQSMIRTRRDLTYGGGRILLGITSARELLAVTAHSPVNNPEAKTVPQQLLAVVAISVSARGQGGAVADKAVERTLADIAGLPEVVRAGCAVILAGVHVENAPSEALLIRQGFECRQEADDAGLRPWALLLEL